MLYQCLKLINVKEEEGKNKDELNSKAGSSASHVCFLHLSSLSQVCRFVTLASQKRFCHCSFGYVWENVPWSWRSWAGRLPSGSGCPQRGRELVPRSLWNVEVDTDSVLLGGLSQDPTQTCSRVLKGILILCCLNSSSYL